MRCPRGRFLSTKVGTWGLSQPSDEAFGAFELKTPQTTDDLTRKEATLVVDLTGQNEVYLDFLGRVDFGERAASAGLSTPREC